MSELSEQHQQVKRGRGRPKKIVSESSEESVCEKKPRGRPVKYAPEEREEKYKELRMNWEKENKNDRNEYKKNLSIKFKTGYIILSKLWKENYLNSISEEDRSRIQSILVD